MWNNTFKWWLSWRLKPWYKQAFKGVNYGRMLIEYYDCSEWVFSDHQGLGIREVEEGWRDSSAVREEQLNPTKMKCLILNLVPSILESCKRAQNKVLKAFKSISLKTFLWSNNHRSHKGSRQKFRNNISCIFLSRAL